MERETREQSPEDPVGCLREAQVLLNAGQLAEAEELIGEAACRFPANAGIAVRHAFLASRRQNWSEALARWARVRADFPEAPEGDIGFANALRGAGRSDEAEILLSESASRFADNGAIAVIYASLAARRRDWPEALARWDSVRERFPDRIEGHTGILTAHRELGHSGELGTLLASASAALQRAREAGIAGDVTDRLELVIGQIGQDWPAVRRAAESLIGRDRNPPAGLVMELAHACWELKALDDAELAATRALAIDPKLTHAALILGWIAAEAGDGEKALAHYRALSDMSPDNPRWKLEAAKLLSFLGRADEYAAEIEQASRRWPRDPVISSWLLNHGLRQPAPGSGTGGSDASGAAYATYIERELRQIADAAPPDAELLRPVMVDDRSRDVIIAAANSAKTVVFVFTGPHDHVTMPLPLFDRHLAAFGVSAIYLKDFDRLTYRKGVRSLGDRGRTLAALQEMTRRVGAIRICTIGVDSGAAIGYGVSLGADRIVCFGASTTARLAPVSVQPLRNVIRKRLAGELRGYRRDLREFLEEHPYSARIEMVYAEGLAADKAQAEHLSGLPRVTMHPQIGTSEHAVLRWMARRECFRPTLAGWLGLQRES
jgi:tetratricopeptide (TPR) repeat protein